MQSSTLFRSAIHPRFADVSLQRRKRVHRDETMGVAIDPMDFRSTLGHYPTGVAIITTTEGDTPVGMAVGSFTSISLDPPLVGFFADNGSSSLPRITGSGRFCVNVLNDQQQQLCRTFSRRGEDRFSGIEWTPSTTGSPKLRESMAWIDCVIDDEVIIGDHTLVVGRVLSADINPETRSQDALIFYCGGYTSSKAE